MKAEDREALTPYLRKNVGAFEAVEAIVARAVNEALTDLDDRCARAVRSLSVVAHAEASTPERARRLDSKREGVELVRDYIRGART